jgi:ditrans,polycis-polyprenyl diphosphate synthase
MSLAKLKLTQLSQHGDLLSRYGASVRVLGQRSLVKPDVLEAIDRAVELTKDNGDAILNVCFPYTSRDEMTTAVRSCVEDWSKPVVIDPHTAPGEREKILSEPHPSHTLRARHLSPSAVEARILRSQSPSPSSKSNSDTEDNALTTSSSATTLQPSTPPDILSLSTSPSLKPRSPSLHSEEQYPDPELINTDTLEAHMFTAGMPPLDLLIRTSGVERLSDFMLWQGHNHTEIVFLSCLWPEFDLWTFLPVLVEWQWRKRKEGEYRRDVKERESKMIGRRKVK